MSYKILALTKYGSLGGSSRYRFYQYLPYLKSQDFDITVAPLLDNAYVTGINQGTRNIGSILSLYCQRLSRSFSHQNYDLLWIEKELLPYIPAWLEKILIGNSPYVVDYDDAQFHGYDQSNSKLVKLLLSDKIDNVMANARLVIAGNQYITERASNAGAKRIEIIPTVVDLDRYSSKVVDANNKEFNIGWIGSPSSSMYLESIQSVFEQLNQKYACRFTMIGSGKLNIENVDLTIKDWCENSEVEDIKNFDVGIMPLYNSLWERGKCGLKLIQYMACSLPVVGSPVGVNQDIIQHGVNGFCADSLDEWTEYLSKLAEDPQLRTLMGAKGRLMVESNYCLPVTAPKLAQLLRSCIYTANA
jgi:glycosyltransferase involved in cell wall biosynthesis